MPAPKLPTILPDWEEFKQNLPANMPYEKLLPTAAEAGYRYMLQQVGAEGLADGSTLITFQVLIGRDGKFEPYDMISMHQHQSIGPVSLAARIQATTTLVYMFFGRVPDSAVPAQPSEQTIDMGAQQGDVKLPGEDPIPDAEPEQEYIPRREAKMPSLVNHLEPDGVPVYIDLDSLPEHFDAGEIITALLADMDAAAVRFVGKEQVIALFEKNGPAVEFLKELGSVEDKTALKDLLDRHAKRIEANAEEHEVRIPGGKGSATGGAPRRRRAA